MSTTPLKVMLLTCSTRPGAIGPTIAHWLMETLEPTASALGAQVRPVSLRDLDLPFLDEEEHPSTGRYEHRHTKEWSALVDAADGFIVVIPEYNYGMPASLKNALDYLGREWAWKPMGFVSYGNTSAGTRSVQHAKQIVTTLRLMPLGATVALRLGEVVVDGRVREDPRLTTATREVLHQLVRVAQAMRPLREADHPASIVGPVPGSYLRRLTPDDAAQVMALQRCCWVDEAVANSTLSIDPLHEDPDEVRTWLDEWTAEGLWLDGRLIGMVRTRIQDAVGHIGRLAVVLDHRGAGIGSWLLARAEDVLQAECTTIELSTGANSRDNIRLYEQRGYSPLRDGDDPGVVTLTRAITEGQPTLA